MTDSKEDKLLAAQLSDRMRQCSENYMITSTSFLDMRQKSFARQAIAAAGAATGFGFYGGYEDAERTVAVFLPDYIEGSPEEHFAANPDDNPLTVLRVSLKKGSKELTHRDYLGSLMGLGIKREVTGDILVRPDGADIIVLKDIASYIKMNMDKAGRNRLDISEVPVEELIAPEHRVSEIVKSVSSLRLDSVAAAVFNLSRGKAGEAIQAGIVYVNGVMADKPERHVASGDKLVLRGKGKVVIKSTDGRSSKDRIIIIADRYV